MELPGKRHTTISGLGAVIMWVGLLILPLLYTLEVVGHFALATLYIGWVGVIASGKLYIIGLRAENLDRLDAYVGASVMTSALASLATLLLSTGFVALFGWEALRIANPTTIAAASFGVFGFAATQSLTAVIQKERLYQELATSRLLRSVAFLTSVIVLRNYGLSGLLVANAISQIASAGWLAAAWPKPSALVPTIRDFKDGMWLSGSSLVVQGLDVGKNQLLFASFDAMTYGVYAHLTRLGRAAHQWPGGLFVDLNLAKAIDPCLRRRLQPDFLRQNAITTAFSTVSVAIGIYTIAISLESHANAFLIGGLVIVEASVIFALGQLRAVVPLVMQYSRQFSVEAVFGALGLGALAIGTIYEPALHAGITLGLLLVPLSQVRWFQKRVLC